jgi:hypothetical protein
MKSSARPNAKWSRIVSQSGFAKQPVSVLFLLAKQEFGGGK